MKTLITGVGGSLGRSLFNKLLDNPKFTQVIGTTHSQIGRVFHNLENKNQSVIVECNLSCENMTKKLLQEYKPELIFGVSGISKQNTPIKELYNSHVLSTLNLLNSITDWKPIFIYISSIVVDSNPLNLYGATKGSAELLIKAYNDINKICGVNVRVCSFHGMGRQGGLLSDILKRLLLINSSTIDLRGNVVGVGSQKPFLFIETLLDFLIELPFHYKWHFYSPIIFSPNDTLCVNEVANIAMKLSGVKKEINWIKEEFEGDQVFLNAKNNIHYFNYKVPTSHEEVEKAIKNILIKEYRYTNENR